MPDFPGLGVYYSKHEYKVLYFYMLNLISVKKPHCLELVAERASATKKTAFSVCVCIDALECEIVLSIQ